MNTYTLILKDGHSDARVERTIEDPLQRRLPSTAAWARAASEAKAWGLENKFRLVVHEIVDAVTGLSLGRYTMPIRYLEDVNGGFEHLRAAAEKFRIGGRHDLAERVEKAIAECESLDSPTPGGR